MIIKKLNLTLIPWNKVQNQTSLFSDDINKVSYLLQNKNTSNWTSEETLSKVLPTSELSNAFFNEFILPVDCENPKDIKF